MKRTWIGVVVIVVLVGAVLLAKSMKSQPVAGPAESGTAAATESQAQPQVILFANPQEAESSCGCGEVFRAVRAASKQGVRTREVDPELERDVLREYRVTVEPTVIFVDATGREVSRREGESGDTIAAIRSDLDRIAGERQ
jgi:hypothetical protein